MAFFFRGKGGGDGSSSLEESEKYVMAFFFREGGGKDGSSP
jgi:hypothetical protein